MVQAPAGRLRALAVAVLLAAGLLVCARQITLTKWYGGHGDYRAQVTAFLEGRLDLDDAPDAARHDLAWTADGVQQVWGLGVPAWETPFELAGRAVGWSPVPDRVALLAFLVLVIFVSIRAWVRPGEAWWIGAGAVAITALSPAFVTLVRSRLGVYEEAAVYAYGAAIVLLGGCALLAQRPSRACYFAVVALAGLVGFVRPTVCCYGLATFVVASALHRRARDIAIGAAVFVLGGSLLAATNAQRFGSAVEFGHHVNLQGLSGNLFATRFSYPFERVGLVEASEELVGALFDSPERNPPERHPGSSFYEKHIHRGQADVPRWREYYFSTFNWAYVPLLVAGLVLGALGWRRDGPSGRGERWLVAWALIGGAPLIGYYLRAPFFSSRYALDLAPAFAALIVIAWRAAATTRRGVLVAGVLAVAWAASVAFARVSHHGPAPVSITAAALASDHLAHAVPYAHPLPAAYDLDDPWLPTYLDWLESFDRCTNAYDAPIDPDDAPVPGDRCLHGELVRDEDGAGQWLVWQLNVGDGEPPRQLCELSPPEEPVCRAAPSAANAGELVAAFIPPPCLYLNMVRWDLVTGQVPPATYAWIDNPEFIELDVSTLDGAPADWAKEVQVEIARTRLALVAISDTARGVRLRFEARGKALPRGLQVAFFAFGPDSELDHAETRFAVHSIRWRAQ